MLKKKYTQEIYLKETNMKEKVLVTGAAGFIGAALTRKLADLDYEVIGLDNINDYYDPNLKKSRLDFNGITLEDDSFNKVYSSQKYPNLKFIRMDITDKDNLPKLFEREKFDYVVNLAAQAGVRYSIKNPWVYVESNILGFLNILECCRNYPVKHLVYASSSSVYGLNENAPFKEDDKVDRPVSLYAASKKSNELMAHAYSKLYGIKCTGLRYFTVYGPWGRPDMAPMLFADAITKSKPINVFNNGDLIRDFTYIDDIVNGTILTMKVIPTPNNDNVSSRVYNIGCSHPVKLMDFIAEMESSLGKSAIKNYMPMQPGDVYMTNADTSKLEDNIGYNPKIQLKEGINNFVIWYKEYFKLDK